MTEKQKKMIEALEATFYNITEACKMVNISRETHYNWLDKYDEYKKACDDILASRINIAESQLHKNIMEGKETSLIFFLKCKAGYTEKHSEEDVKPLRIQIERLGKR